MKITSKQADASLAKLTSRITSAMERNTTLATGKGSLHSASPVATYTAQPVAPKPQAPIPPPVTPRHARSTSGVRLNAGDLARIRQIVQAGFDLQQQLTTSDAIRLALRAFDPKRLTASDIAQVRAETSRAAQPVAQ